MTNNKPDKKVLMLLAHDFIYPYVDPRPYKEAKSLIAKGYAVSMICWSKLQRNVTTYEDYDGIGVYRIISGKANPGKHLFDKIPSYLLYVLRSLRKSIQLKPDIVHCHDLDTLVIGVLYKCLCRKKLIFDAHEDYPSMVESMPEIKYPVLTARLLRIYERLLIKFADTVVAAEQLYTDTMKNHYGISPVVILNLPSLQHFNPEVDATKLVDQYGLYGKLVISQVGAIGENRGTFETLEALRYLSSSKVKLILIGKSSAATRNKLLELISKYDMEHVVIPLLDGIRYEDIPMYYRVSDVTMALLYPVSTYSTSVPTKLYESLAMGIPVVAADLPHIRAIVDTYQVGLCADSRNARDIAEKLNTLLADEYLRRRMRENGIHISRKLLNWDYSADKLIESYESL